MASRLGTTSTAAAAASLVWGAAVAQNVGIFGKLAGSWAGGGTVSVMNGGAERLRCRADYAPAGETRLHLDITCASDSFKMQISSDLARSGNAISGTWREATFGASGNVSGSVGGDRINAVVQGMGLSARLSLALRGKTQSVTLASRGQIAGTANVTLRRN